MAFGPEGDTLSDEDLVDRVRAGDREAYGVLWQRHSAAALSVARQYQGVADPDDILQEAAKTVFSSILRGGGPFGSFRPYLKQSVRNAAVSISRRKREAPVGGLEDIAEHSTDISYDDNDNALERMITVRAFKALPPRWQEVLWYTCVEGMPAREAASRLGLSANATAALAKRAREGLRRSWLEAHLSDDRLPPECRSIVQRLPAYERSALSASAASQVESHLSDCLRCSIVAGELDGIADRLPVILLPLAIAGVDIFGRVTALAQAYLASNLVAGSASGSVGGATGVGAGGQSPGVASTPGTSAPVHAGAGGSGSSSASGSAGGSNSVTAAAVGAGASAGIASAAGHAALLTTKALWIGAAAVAGIATVAVAGINVLSSDQDTPTPAAISDGPSSPNSGHSAGATPAPAPTPASSDEPLDAPAEPDSAATALPDQAKPATGVAGQMRRTQANQNAGVLAPGVPSQPQPTPEPLPSATPSHAPSPEPSVKPTGPEPPLKVSPAPTVLVMPRPGDLSTAASVAGRGMPGAVIELSVNERVVSAEVDEAGDWQLYTPSEFINRSTITVRQQIKGQDVSAPVILGVYSMLEAPMAWPVAAEGSRIAIPITGRSGETVVVTTDDGQRSTTTLMLGFGLVELDGGGGGLSRTITVSYFNPKTEQIGRQRHINFDMNNIH